MRVVVGVCVGSVGVWGCVSVACPELVEGVAGVSVDDSSVVCVEVSV